MEPRHGATDCQAGRREGSSGEGDLGGLAAKTKASNNNNSNNNDNDNNRGDQHDYEL